MSEKTVEEALKEFIALVEEHKPPCRERSLAITKLQEAVFWLGAIPNEAWDQPGQIVGGPWRKW